MAHYVIIISLYRLDVGDGKDLELNECPRSKLRQQCIVYLGPVSSFVLFYRKRLTQILIPFLLFQQWLSNTLSRLFSAREGKLWIHHSAWQNYPQTIWKTLGHKPRISRSKVDICHVHCQETLCWWSENFNKCCLHTLFPSNEIITYINDLQKKKGMFHHSSFLAGGATLAAGRLETDDGVLKVGRIYLYDVAVF